jgi:chromate transport protein ChrA
MHAAGALVLNSLQGCHHLQSFCAACVCMAFCLPQVLLLLLLLLLLSMYIIVAHASTA